jgi:hypothetical protein
MRHPHGEASGKARRMPAGTSRICSSKNRWRIVLRIIVGRSSIPSTFRFHTPHNSPSGEFKPRFRLVNLYANRSWRFRSTESIEKNVKEEAYLLAVTVFIAAVDFSRRLIAALFPSTTTIPTLDELVRCYIDC